MGETVLMEFLYAIQHAGATLSMLLYPVSVLVRLLLATAIGYSATFMGASGLEKHILSLAYRRLALRPTPHRLVSRYSCPFSL